MTRNRHLTINDCILNVMDLLLLMQFNNITRPLNNCPRRFSHIIFQAQYSDRTKNPALGHPYLCGNVYIYCQLERIPVSYSLASICMLQSSSAVIHNKCVVSLTLSPVTRRQLPSEK